MKFVLTIDRLPAASFWIWHPLSIQVLWTRAVFNCFPSSTSKWQCSSHFAFLHAEIHDISLSSQCFSSGWGFQHSACQLLPLSLFKSLRFPLLWSWIYSVVFLSFTRNTLLKSQGLGINFFILFTKLNSNPEIKP